VPPVLCYVDTPLAQWTNADVEVLEVGLLAALVLALHDRLASEDLLGDLLREARVRRQCLPDLDRRAASAPRRSDIVVCLTTTPTRAPRLEPTLRSLLDQSLPPARVRLHLPHWSLREDREYQVPAFVRGLSMVELVRCDDEGPATKLLPALRAFAGQPEQRVLVVDDDRIYQRHLVGTFDAASAAHPTAAVAARGWVVPDDLLDRPTTLLSALLQRPPTPIACTRVREPRQVDVMQGLAGYLVRPSFFDLAALTDYRDAPPEARRVDDVWISGHCRVPRLVVPMGRTNFDSLWDARFYGRTAISRAHRGDGRLEARANTIVLRHLASRWRSVG
jgi:hypothetical protein